MFGLGYLMASLMPTNSAAVASAIVALIGGVCSGLAFQDAVPIWTFYFAEGLFRAEIQDVIDHAGADLHYVVQYAHEVYGYRIGDDVIAEDVQWILIYSAGFRALAYFVLHARLLSFGSLRDFSPFRICRRAER